jgi:hypothetical protein
MCQPEAGGYWSLGGAERLQEQATTGAGDYSGVCN